ncbi:MAG: hypothetical protein ACRC6O_10550 [Flavobacterium sp.]
MKITKRDVNVFLFGMLTWMSIEFIYDWENNVKDFEKGWESAGTNSK